MKNKLLFGMLIMTATLSAQTMVNLSGMTSDITLGTNCSSSQIVFEYETPGDANLNGYTVHLRNANLKVNGNINGGGSISGCGQSSFCKTGVIQNNPSYSPSLLVNCSVLSMEEFHDISEIPRGLKYAVYDMTGRLLSKGNTDALKLPRNTIFILKVEGFKVKKLIISK